MMISLSKYSESVFTLLLGLAFISVFLGQATMHLVGLAFIIALIIFRPKLPWIAPFWWMLAFIIWEFLSDYLGPYQGDGMESGGIGYHFLFLFIPLALPTINYGLVIIYAGVGAGASAVLMWMQEIIGYHQNHLPWRINWEFRNHVKRPTGFNSRAWVIQFIHSIITLTLLQYINWKKTVHWIILASFLSGTFLPQVRAIVVAFCAGIGTQLLFKKREDNKNNSFFKRSVQFLTISILLIIITASFRPNFFQNMSNANGRDAIFITSIEIFKLYPHTGLGGGEYFEIQYSLAWQTLLNNENLIIKQTNQSKPFLSLIGHPHNDFLMLLVHHGWPALFFWLGFVLHSLRFVWSYGSHKERIIFISIVSFHHIAGLAETYLDYSNTAYAIFLCYGLAMHGPIKRYLETKDNTAL